MKKFIWKENPTLKALYINMFVLCKQVMCIIIKLNIVQDYLRESKVLQYFGNEKHNFTSREGDELH